VGAARPGELGRAAASLGEFCGQRGLLLQTSAELRRSINELTRALTAALWVLLVLMFLVAGLGAGQAVAASASEQARDAALLRAVGMAPRDVRRAAVLQGLLITLGGLLPGLVVGAALAAILGRTVEGLWGYRIPFLLRWDLAAGVAGTAAVVGLLASALAVPTGGNGRGVRTGMAPA
jgi:putative ABC transport system permease protein